MPRLLNVIAMLVMLTLIMGLGIAPAYAQWQPLASAPSAVDNPLKGLVPYSAAQVDRFPHSVEFFYLSMKELMVGPREFDWSAMERELDRIAERGCQAVFRIWIEYPGQASGLPNFLRDQGVKVTEWINEQENPPKSQFTPDYEDERLVTAMENFIAALGQRYDRDPRVGFITAGLLGEWGEWHNWPRDELFASKKTQQRVLSAYQQAFQSTPILLRYPAGKDHRHHADNSNLPFGYHDDSFAWGTLSTDRPDDFWYYMTALQQAGQPALEKWKTQPIGGEIRPELWGQIFDRQPAHEKAQDFEQCLRQTHATWLMDSGMFNRQQSEERNHNAMNYVRLMGYDFWIKAAKIETNQAGQTIVSIAVINQGVAPFYRDWPLEIAVADIRGSISESFTTDWSLRYLLPSDQPTVLRCALPIRSLGKEDKLLLRVVNPLKNGKPLKFANVQQDQDLAGWLTLNP